MLPKEFEREGYEKGVRIFQKKEGEREMIPYNKILCPIDFRESSYEGLKAATELARHFSAELFVLHVISTAPIIYAVPTGPMMVNIPLHQQEQE
jgi:hypothetical protein